MALDREGDAANSSEASAKSPRRGPKTVTSTSAVAPGVRLGSSQLVSRDNVSVPAGSDGQAVEPQRTEIDLVVEGDDADLREGHARAQPNRLLPAQRAVLNHRAGLPSRGAGSQHVLCLVLPYTRNAARAHHRMAVATAVGRIQSAPHSRAAALRSQPTRTSRSTIRAIALNGLELTLIWDERLILLRKNHYRGQYCCGGQY